MKLQYANAFIQKFEMGDPTTRVYQLIYYEKDNDEATIINDLIMN